MRFSDGFGDELESAVNSVFFFYLSHDYYSGLIGFISLSKNPI